jgi:hypothetical protein
MSNRYVERFFMLTEQNILIDDDNFDRIPVREETTNMSRPRLGKGSLFQQFDIQKQLLWFSLIFFVVSLVAFNYQKDEKVELGASLLPKVTPLKVIVANAPQFISVIPGFRVSSTRQLLHNVSLKKVDLALLSGNSYENDSDSNLLLMDKVIFVPKLFG